MSVALSVAPQEVLEKLLQTTQDMLHCSEQDLWEQVIELEEQRQMLLQHFFSLAPQLEIQVLQIALQRILISDQQVMQRIPVRQQQIVVNLQNLRLSKQYR